ncbi:hypothetical protein [Nocardioides sp. AX2bis]|uniref:hypothetical protein n=1 Tax=Nocardioides sp. AX2bis TaxID=2653157 RepID=UPI0012F2D218|nr:hypothetical protein [Nocardioides sp. AX2bis]VXB96067.1 conserved hypothetical protein [Nocardioides sp. AX2bis]
MRPQVLELIAVEHAAGGQAEETPTGTGGERGTDDHCGLCGLTVDKAAWEAIGEELGVPVTLHTSDDLSPEESPVVREVGTPAVIARFEDNEFHAVVLAERLEVFDGDVTRLVREVRLVAEQQGWDLQASEQPEERPETL